MSNERWITVAEYAAIKGITVQAVYKQIKRKGFKLETRVESGKTLILCDSLEEVQQPIKPGIEPVVKPVQQPDSTETIEFLKAEIERLHSVIEAREKAIEVEKQEKENLRIDMQRTIDSLTDLVKQSNLLVANAQNKLPDPKAEEEEVKSGEVNTVETAATEVPADTVTVPAARVPEPKQQPQPNKPKSPVLPKQKKQKQKWSFWGLFK